MGQYRKKPVVIEARWFDGSQVEAERLRQWIGCAVAMRSHGPERFWILDIHTLEGSMIARTGDWIIKGVKGEFYPCKPDIFAQTYEPATYADAVGQTPSNPI